MYFNTTWWIGLMMLGCAFFQLPTAKYFDSKSYDRNNAFDRTWITGVSQHESHLLEKLLDFVNCTPINLTRSGFWQLPR